MMDECSNYMVNGWEGGVRTRFERDEDGWLLSSVLLLLARWYTARTPACRHTDTYQEWRWTDSGAEIPRWIEQPKMCYLIGCQRNSVPPPNKKTIDITCDVIVYSIRSSTVIKAIQSSTTWDPTLDEILSNHLVGSYFIFTQSVRSKLQPNTYFFINHMIWNWPRWRQKMSHV